MSPQVRDSLRHSLSPQRRERLAQVLADAAALAGWQAVDMGRLPAAWNYFELATDAALRGPRRRPAPYL